MGKSYQKLFARFYDSFMGDFERSLFKTRRDMLQNIEGNVIEVGAGTGVNFKFYSDKAKVIAIEPSKPMLLEAEKKIGSNSNIDLVNYGVCDKELSNIIKEESADYIVSMLVLCTIPNPKKALDYFKKWLKPGGKLIILEHIHAQKSHNKKIQNIINPAWRAFADGCNLNRNTDILLEEAGFKPISEEYIKRSLRFVKGVYRVVGSE